MMYSIVAYLTDEHYKSLLNTYKGAVFDAITGRWIYKCWSGFKTLNDAYTYRMKNDYKTNDYYYAVAEE
jgi:hypothetical protein